MKNSFSKKKIISLKSNKIFFHQSKKKHKSNTSLLYNKLYFKNKFFSWIKKFIFKKRITGIFKIFYVYRKIKLFKAVIKPTKKKQLEFANFLIKYRKFVINSFKASVPKYFKPLNSKIKYLRYIFNRRKWKFKSKLHLNRRQFFRNKLESIPFYPYNFNSKITQFSKGKKVKTRSFSFREFKKIYFLNFGFKAVSPYRFIFINNFDNSKVSPFLVKMLDFFNPLKMSKRIPKYFYSSKKSKKSYFSKLKFFRNSRKNLFFFKIYKNKGSYKRFKRFYKYKNLKNRFYFFSSKQNFFKNLETSASPFIVKKKRGKFLPFLGFFSKFGKVFYKFRRKRLKFFKFFKKYFRLFQSFSGVITKKFKKIRKKFSFVKLYLHVFRSVNNFFVNLSAPKGRSVYVYSAGRTFYKGSKRLSPIALETMGKNISNVFKISKIDNIFLVFHCPIDYLCRSLIRGMSKNVKFSGFSYYLNRPHNGLRKRATRRV